MSRSAARPRPGAFLAAAALLAAHGAAAAEPLAAAISVRGGRLVASLDLSSAFPPQSERTFGNGLTNVVALHVTLAAPGEPPAALTGRVIDILFDVWDETYAVTTREPNAPGGVRTVLPDYAALRAFLAYPRDVDLGPASSLPQGSFVVEARVDVNPVSQELLERTREFIANPSATQRPGGSRSVLGAMASFLLREPETGGGVHVFRSRPMAPAEVTGR
ncbi:MAG TPA: hypothetical protein VLU43_14255 [Anaeromyxobacteraceae bacterium]|nr:hypothetical protein [Anaeromyxobacteraceae bacterium]